MALFLQPIDLLGKTGLDAQLDIGHHIVEFGFELLVHFFSRHVTPILLDTDAARGFHG